ncbi:hypothetical protein E2562_012169 [Oryza meyeriana var. granulata]|uniref:Nascent polypeptide-associated complex subunit beta n=1 Tax=Oryza meyeriana var. granulata TaxID=110450 RepID=A0A6G1F7L1_9ORYZ|nr:hypothetical protein E2562_012169 [Oryza meyeriana var. granulata]
MDEDDLLMLDGFFASQPRLSHPGPGEAALPHYIGYGLPQLPMLQGGDPEEAAPAFPQPRYAGECSAQPPKLGGSMEAASAFQQYIGDYSAQPQTLGGSMGEAAAAFQYYNGNGNGDGSALPPMTSSGRWAGLSGMGEPAPFAPSESDPSNAIIEPLNDAFTPRGDFSPEDSELMFQLFNYIMARDGQSMPGAGIMEDSLLGTNETTIHNSAATTDQVHTLAWDYPHGSAATTDQVVQQIAYSNTPALGYPQPPATAAAVTQAQHMLYIEAMEMAELYRVASECGDETSMVWSPDEDKLLLDGLSRLANQDSVSVCIEIAYSLPKKTAMDVGKRIRWFQRENKSAAQAGVGSKESAGGKTRKGKGTEDPNMKRNKHASSEKTQDYKSIKASIRDNSRLMNRIDDNLKTGQLVHIPGIFDDVKMNMSAILTKMREIGISTDEFKIDVEALEEVKQGFHSLAEERLGTDLGGATWGRAWMAIGEGMLAEYGAGEQMNWRGGELTRVNSMDQMNKRRKKLAREVRTYIAREARDISVDQPSAREGMWGARLERRRRSGSGGRAKREEGNEKMNVDKLKKMAGAVRTGGKGSMRRKKKAVHKTTTTDDKRLQSTLKRVGVNTIPGIEEVNIFKDDVVIQFQNPKVQASIAANTWVVSGTPQTKKLQDLLPTIINQLGPDNLDNLRRLAEQFQKQVPGAESGASAGNAQDDDDDVPELVPGQTFEEAAEVKKEPEEKEAEPEEKKESA